MPKSHYINPRFYQNEKTISLNPSKPFNHKRRKPKNYSFLKSLIFVLIIFSAFIGYSVYANENNSKNDKWTVSHSESSAYTYIYTHTNARDEGNIADTMVFTIDNKNCNDLWVTFIIHSVGRPQIPQYQKFNVSITELDPSENKIDEYELIASALLSESLGSYQKNAIELETTFELPYWINYLSKHELDKVRFLLLSENQPINPHVYFNYVSIDWNVLGLRNILVKEFDKCKIKKVIVDSIIS